MPSFLAIRLYWFDELFTTKAFVVDVAPLPVIKTGPSTAKLPEMPAEPVNGNAGPPPVDGAHDALNAWVAYDAVPSKLPVIPPVTFSEPDMITLPLTSKVELAELLPMPNLWFVWSKIAHVAPPPVKNTPLPQTSNVLLGSPVVPNRNR